MITRKLILAALSATMIAGSVGGAAFARDMAERPLPAMARPALFVFMLKNFDSNKDGKVTADEAKAGAETLFAAIDTDKDGALTPKEMRTWRKAKMEAMRDAMKKDGADAGPMDDGADGPDGMAPADGPKDAMKDGKGRHHGKHHGMHGMHGMMGGGMMRMLDSDENGQVSKQEAVDAAAKLVAQMDTNKDGAVSIDDFPG